MNNKLRTKFGLTLIEMLVVVSIIAILVAIVIGVATRIETQSKEKLTKSTIALLDAALAQFRDYGYSYPANCAGFEFPLDCNGLDKSQIEQTLNYCGDPSRIVSISGIDPNNSGIAVTYSYLSKIPDCRNTLDKIDRALIVNTKETIAFGSDSSQLIKIIDPWKTALRYNYYTKELLPLTPTKIKKMWDSRKSFPVITSAGPDKKFNTGDDIW